MNGRQTRHSSMFLLELMIAILFFCLAATVCIRLIVKSHIISQKTQNLNMALNQVTTAAEIFKSETDVEEYFKNEFPQWKEIKDGFAVYYNEKWEACKKKDAKFQLSIEITQKAKKAEGYFSMKDIETNQEIYDISLNKFIWEE